MVFRTSSARLLANIDGVMRNRSVSEVARAKRVRLTTAVMNQGIAARGWKSTRRERGEAAKYSRSLILANHDLGDWTFQFAQDLSFPNL